MAERNAREWVRGATPMEALNRSTPPSGYRYWWRVDEDWCVPNLGPGRCRFSEGRKACGEPAIASLMRPVYNGTGSKRAWDYCPEHLYGRIFEDGQVLVLSARKLVEVAR